MFRPPPHHRHGGPPQNNGLYPEQSPGMTIGGAFVPQAFSMHGRGRGLHPPFHGEHYSMFPPSGPPSLVRPPPPPGSPPVEIPPPPPPSDTNFRSIPKPAPPPPPPMPKDPEMLKNIEILSSFVVRNGLEFENMARAKQAGDPKFAFLFGGERGSDAAFGFDFYNWKKEHLIWVEERTRASPVDLHRPSEQGRNEGPAVVEISRDSPDSPPGSDMDMEDDFDLPHPTRDKDSDLDRTPALPSSVFERKSGPSPTLTERLGALSPAPEWTPDFSSSSLLTRPALPLLASERKAGHGLVESKVGGQLHRDSAQQSENRLAAEMQGNAHGGKTARAKDMSKSQMERTSLDVPKRRDTRRRTGFDRPCMEDVSPKDSPVRNRQQRGSSPSFDSCQKGTSGNGHREVPTKLSRWGPEPSECLGSAFAASDKILETNKGSKKLDSCTQKKGESSFSKDRCQSPDVAAKLLRSLEDGNFKDNARLKATSESGQPAVDEFGRLLRQGGSDSDLDNNWYGGRKKRRRTLSRSRSRSPEDVRFKYQSPEQSSSGWVKRSRSWSCSPRKNRSRSLTPPHERRWGGEGRSDRGPLDKGGRRVGRCVGGTTATCYDYIKGKCLRGSSCRFLHSDSHGGNGDQVGKWIGRRGQHREQGQNGRVGEEGDRNWGGRSGDDAKRWRPWASDERSRGEPRESKLIAELKEQEHGIDASLNQDKGTSDDSVKSAEEAGRTGNYQQVASSSDTMTKAFAPSSIAPSTSQWQSSIPPGPICQAGSQISVIPRPLLSQQPSALASDSNSRCESHKLGIVVSPVSQQSSFAVSPPPHSQQLQFSSALPHLQQNALLTSSQSQKPGHQPLPTLSQVNSFSPDALHQQFTPARNLPSGSSPLFQVLPPSFSGAQLGRPRTSSKGSQLPNFALFSKSNGQGSVQFRPHVCNGQPQMLPSSTVQGLHSKPGLAWMPGAPTTSYPQGRPQPLQKPLQPPSLPLPPQVSTAAAGIYSYALTSSYAMPSYSTLSSSYVLSRPRPSTQYDPLSDSLEPAPPGSIDKKGVVSNGESSSQEKSVKPSKEEQWRHNPGGMAAPLMTNAGEVVLENVSPGLPGHMETVGRGHGIMGRISPVPQPQMVMETLSPTDVGNSVQVKASMKLGGPEHRVQMENVSPPDAKPKEAGEDGKRSAPRTVEEKKKDKEGRVLNLIRKAVAEQVKDLLRPTWKGGQITKDAFKIIAKKAVDKVMGALEVKGLTPKTQEKVDAFMKTSKPKIAKLVQGYVDKYVRA